ncbi:hybrid sensor histidine kinase/response regulator [Granulicella arctica]|uniref:histidine kinase n=1 Tax=Granulicella arctica TaxID=940613 RepID=A0A7Y9THG3_9BACT|nr:hybrid sensor histidine kinase/response regulator [Granulicella arctica]NYF80499.1 PAS domain S-box-containing protein [Granulicella arctica]
MSAEELEPRHLKVLLIEDNPDDAFLLERHLRRNGFTPEVTRVETTGEMLAVLEEATSPDVVLADYNLPNFSGPAALQLLKSAGIDIPFIMMSGAVSEETAVESMRAGAQDYVSKQNLTRLIPALERELKEAFARRRRVAAELALRASEARFHRLVEAMPLSLLISAASGRILYANGAAERLLGYAPGDIPSGIVTLDSICPTLNETYSALKGHAVSIEPFETVCTTTSGQKVDVLIGVALLNPESATEDQQVAAFIADLTLQKKSEELLRRTEKLAVTGRLAASIAHEINNPLEAVTNCLFLLSTAELSAESRGFLELAQKELDRVAQITVQTLRFYRRSTHPSQMDVRELIETVIALFESRMLALQIKVIREFETNVLVLAHDGEIRQVIVNLIGNAIDALSKGGHILIRTTTARHWRSGRDGIRITVADDGMGMSAETQSHIFEPFFSTKGITGAGLGLWVSREIVDKHQGSLRTRSRQASSSRQGWTVFTLFIPTEIDPSLTTES